MLRKFAVAIVAFALVTSLVLVSAAFASPPVGKWEQERVDLCRLTADEVVNPVWTAFEKVTLDKGGELRFSHYAAVFFTGRTEQLMPVYADEKNNLYLLISPYVFTPGVDPFQVSYMWPWLGTVLDGKVCQNGKEYAAELLPVADTSPDLATDYFYPYSAAEQYVSKHGYPAFLVVRNYLHIE